MPAYIWKGKNSYGEKRKGTIEALNKEAAISHLKKNQDYRQLGQGKTERSL